MLRIQTLTCGGICLMICFVTTAQSLPKNPTVQQVISNHVYQQKLWNYNQLPKRSIQYISHPKYTQLTYQKSSSTKLNITSVTTPEVKKNFSTPAPRPISNKYLQNSRFLRYMWSDRKQTLGHSL